MAHEKHILSSDPWVCLDVSQDRQVRVTQVNIPKCFVEKLWKNLVNYLSLFLFSAAQEWQHFRSCCSVRIWECVFFALFVDISKQNSMGHLKLQVGAVGRFREFHELELDWFPRTHLSQCLWLPCKEQLFLQHGNPHKADSTLLLGVDMGRRWTFLFGICFSLLFSESSNNHISCIG